MTSDEENIKALADVNRRFVAKGESLPAVILPDGSKVQTGTVGALLRNIKLYDRICAGETIEGMNPNPVTACNLGINVLLGIAKGELEKMMVIPIPTLAKVGLFEVFTPDEWMAGASSGRRFVGVKAKELGY